MVWPDGSKEKVKPSDLARVYFYIWTKHNRPPNWVKSLPYGEKAFIIASTLVEMESDRELSESLKPTGTIRSLKAAAVSRRR